VTEGVGSRSLQSRAHGRGIVGPALKNCFENCGGVSSCTRRRQNAQA
jgi:hypothetical protein